MRCVLYLRMSSDKQEVSVGDQRAECTKHAAEKKYRILGEYVDEGISGDATEKRKAFQRMIADGSKKRFDLVLCWDQDRFGRFDPVEGGYWIKPLRDAGVMLETIAQGRIDWSDFASRLQWTVVQEGKHAYIRDLARNCCRGLRRAVVERGVFPGMAPFGYRKQDKKLVLGPPEEIAVVREVFRLKATGMGYRTIAVRLANEGKPFPKSHIKSRPGSGWSSNQVRYIINRRTYLGTLTYGQSKARGKYSNVGDTITKIDAVPAIVTQAEWDAAHRTKRNNTVHSRNGGYVGALAGMVYCGQCGSVMYRFKRPEGYGYVCGTYHRGLGCGFCRVMDAEILSAVAQEIRRIAGDSVPKLVKAIEAESRRDSAGVPRDQLRRRLAELDQQIDRAAARILTVPDSALKAVQKKLAEMQAARDEIAEKLAASMPATKIDARKIAGHLVALPELIARPGIAPEILRAAVQAYVSRIKVDFRLVRQGRIRRFYEVSSLEIIYSQLVQNAIVR